jgi:mannose-6-phosphate isomerase-like protein (cupin superfamily)
MNKTSSPKTSNMLRGAIAGQKSEIATQNGSVVLIRDVLRRVEAQPYLNFIQEFRFDGNLFNKLLNGTHNDWIGTPIEMDYPSTKPVEHIIIRNAATPDGKKIEATLTTMFAPSTMKVRLPKPPEESIGFEAILLQEGSITYDILPGFNQIAGAYTAIGKPTSITLQPGDLLLIPRSVARQVSKVVDDPKYLYIGDPWTKDDMPVEVKLGSFVVDGKPRPVRFVETQKVKEGVECDIYSFVDDSSRDLAVVTVKPGYKTPLQRVLSGDKTVEGIISGEGALTIRKQNGEPRAYEFKNGENKDGVVVQVGQIMQWEAGRNSDLVFYEVCYPPYQDGRFENLKK